MLRSAHEIVNAAIRSWSDHRAIRIGAGVSYYWLFAIVPLATLALQLATAFFSSSDIARWILEAINEYAEESGSVELQRFLQGLIDRAEGVTVSVVTVVAAAVTASFAFAATQDANNMVWDAPRLRGFSATLRRRVLLVIAAIAVSALLIVLLLTIAIVGAVDDLLPGSLGDQAVGILATLAPYAVAFGVVALSFRYMPRPKVPWKPAAIGALITVAALAIATFGYSIYLNLTPQTTLSGAAGSILATLVWLYVLAQVYVAGSVLTRAIHEHAQVTTTDGDSVVHDDCEACENGPERTDDQG